TPIHSHLQREEVEYILDNCRARLFVTSEKLRSTVAAIERDNTPVEHFFAIGQVDGYEDFIAASNAQPHTPVADQVAGTHMMYSSGTTGKPKGILPDWVPSGYDDVPAMLKATVPLMGISAETVYL